MPVVQSNKIQELANRLTSIYAPGIHVGGGPEHNLESILFRRLMGAYTMMGIDVVENRPKESNPGVHHQGSPLNTSLLSDVYEQRIKNFNSIDPLEIVKNDQTFFKKSSPSPQEEFKTEREKSINLDSVTEVKIDSKLKTDEFFTLLKRNTDWYQKQMKALQEQKDQKQIDIDEYFALEAKISNQHAKNMDTINDLKQNDKTGTINFNPIVTPQAQEAQAMTDPNHTKAQNPFQAFQDAENQNTIERSEAINKLQKWFREQRAKFSPTDKPELYFTKANLDEYEKNLEPIQKEFQERLKVIEQKWNEGKLTGVSLPTSNYTFFFRATPTGQLFERTVKVSNNAINRFGDPIELIRRPNGELHAIFINPKNGEKVAIPAALANS